ncbi:Placenta-specific gene 8 protein C15 [Larimichthys crocea]|uniref:Placenta-specific gene 8 protein C15 n=1 Tax=Larimichthys crocea TaxID=215358 RepID=A0A6G0I2A2_LARCR|nr:Placenta-specific gene 8 protein C15 [Larimichthys crocea]
MKDHQMKKTLTISRPEQPLTTSGTCVQLNKSEVRSTSITCSAFTLRLSPTSTPALRTSDQIMAVTNQPGRFQPSDFQTGLCDFCDDCGTCFYGLCCYACLGCTVARDMDECCLCGLSVAIRSVYRTRYNINGSLSEERHRPPEGAEHFLSRRRHESRRAVNALHRSS